MRPTAKLEHKGLASGRPGLGTFVEGSSGGVMLPDLAALRRTLRAWLQRADAAGLDEDGIVALVSSTMRDFSEGPRRFRTFASRRRRGVNILESFELGRRYGAKWALRDCSLAIPEGHLVALVGPNGAGKSTLLNMVVGLTAPSTGQVTVLGGHRAGSLAALDGVGFVAQDMPLHRHLSVADTLHLTRNLNRHFDTAYALRRMAELGIECTQKAGKLSGGQQAQLALTLALARHPRLLVLDEPTASLDPLARHEFMATVMTAMSDDGISVVLSSHLLAELERVADYLVLISNGRVRIEGAVEDLLACHRLVTTPTSGRVPEIGWEVIESNAAVAQTQRLVRLSSAAAPLPPTCESRPVGIEELALAYLREAGVPTNARMVGAAR